MDYKVYSKLSRIARGIDKADLILKNASILNVFTEEFIKGDLAIAEGLIIGIGKYEGEKELDMSGKYIVPGFIDSHLHLESTLVRPSELIKEALKYGTTSFVVDPHEAANVSGNDGIEYILDQTSRVPANVYVMAPSCVPATPFEDNGCILTAENMKKYIDNDRILGLGEVMDCSSVIEGKEDMLEKLDLFQNKTMDGHAPVLRDEDLAAYVLAGIKTDHECTEYEYAKKECMNGMYVFIREGSAAKNLEAIIKGILDDKASTERYCFCTDDKHIEEIKEQGHISYNVKKAISMGIPVVKAFKMASYNPSICYGMKSSGAIAPGYQADLVVLSDLENVKVAEVFYKGINFKDYVSEEEIKCPDHLKETIHVKGFSKDKLKIKVAEDEFPVVGIIPGQIVTKKLLEKVPSKDGEFIPNKTYSKIAVIERHKYTGKTGVGILKGFGITNGAIASSVSHDSHNIIVVGDNDEDMEIAVKELIRQQGGYTIVSERKVVNTLPLPIMGLMSDAGHEEVNEKLTDMIQYAHKMGIHPGIEPFINLSFMALPVIPEIRITARGIYDIENNRFYNDKE